MSYTRIRENLPAPWVERNHPLTLETRGWLCVRRPVARNRCRKDWWTGTKIVPAIKTASERQAPHGAAH